MKICCDLALLAALNVASETDIRFNANGHLDRCARNAGAIRALLSEQACASAL